MSLELSVRSQKFWDVEFMKWTLQFTPAVLLCSFQKLYTRCYGIFFICTCVRHFNQPPYYNTTEPLATTANMHELDQVISLQAHFPSINNLITNCKFDRRVKTTYHSRSLISPSSSCDIWTGRRDLIWLKPTHISATSSFVLLLIMYVFCKALMSSPMLSYCRTNKLQHKMMLKPTAHTFREMWKYNLQINSQFTHNKKVTVTSVTQYHFW